MKLVEFFYFTHFFGRGSLREEKGGRGLIRKVTSKVLVRWVGDCNQETVIKSLCLYIRLV